MNVALPKDLAAAFKARCAACGVSAAGEIARMVRESLGMPQVAKIKAAPAAPRFDTRLGRRKAVKDVIWRLGEIRDAEQSYMDGMPEQLLETNGAGIDDAVAALDAAIGELACIEIYPEPPSRRKTSRGAGSAKK
ncbi:MAG: hypothetical protein LBI68_05230 [Azoarcus sp.]|nr:hypothetical protein [Azoarcus sp.]